MSGDLCTIWVFQKKRAALDIVTVSLEYLPSHTIHTICHLLPPLTWQMKMSSRLSLVLSLKASPLCRKQLQQRLQRGISPAATVTLQFWVHSTQIKRKVCLILTRPSPAATHLEQIREWLFIWVHKGQFTTLSTSWHRCRVWNNPRCLLNRKIQRISAGTSCPGNKRTESLNPALPLSLLPSAGCCWNCWSFCLTSSRQWPRLTAWCWPTCSGSQHSAQPGLTKRASSCTSRLTSLPRFRQSCRSVQITAGHFLHAVLFRSRSVAHLTLTLQNKKGGG